MDLTPQQEQLLADRYGVRQRSSKARRLQVIGGLSGLAVMIVGTWWFSSSNYNPVSYEVVSFQVMDEWRVGVEFEISAPAGTELSCDLQAMDQSFGVVGHKTVNLAAVSEEVARYAVELRTTTKAVTAVVEICRVK